MIPDVEVSDVAGVAPRVQKYGLALWRGLVSAEDVNECLKILQPKANHEPSYLVPQRGVMAPENLPVELRARIAGGGISDAFRQMLGGDFYIDDNESPIFIVPPQLRRIWVWHQDAAAIALPCAIAWIALTPCGAGTRAPGIEFVLSPKREVDPVLVG